MRQRLLKINSIFTVVFLVVITDQASKSLARQELLPGISTRFIPGLINLYLVKNTGAAFSLFSGSTPLLAILSLTVSIILIIWLLRSSAIPFWQGLAGGFLLGGTIGNGIDRWLHNGVTDFLQLVPVNFPIFNIADLSINIAIICFALNSLISRQRKHSS